MTTTTAAAGTVDSDFIPPLSVLKGLKLKLLLPTSPTTTDTTSTINSENLWTNQACLIYLVRRPGCILCRNKGKELLEIRDKLKQNGIGMAAIVHEELGVEEFRSKFWPNDPIYLNSDKSFFSAVHEDRKVQKQSLLSGLFSSDMWRRIHEAKSAGVEGNLHGEGRILGGILLVGKGESGVKWVRREKSFGICAGIVWRMNLVNLTTINTNKYEKDSKVVYSYGTAGFRMNANLMAPVAFRVGLLSALLSQFYGGAYVGVMVTASHNPVQDNGVKLIDPNGEMVIGRWEELATKLANTSDSNLSEILTEICQEMNISNAAPVKVAVGRDTRPSGIELVEAIEVGVRAVSASGTFVNLQLQTTPQCHFAIFELNKFGKFGEYFEHFSSQFEKLLRGKRLTGELVIDAANGIGAQSAKTFRDRLCQTTGFNPTILNTGREAGDVLNQDCGADFVKIQMAPPKGVESKLNVRFASLDGDADRLIYFYFDSSGEFKMLDGDRISVLFAFFMRKLLKEAGLEDQFRFGVVQTAYANGASSDFLRSQGISVSIACTGVKNLHHVAAESYDIGIYFEANGHGTVLFNSKATEALETNPAGEKLLIVKNLVNQCVGDAMSDLLLVEAILCEEEMVSLSRWDGLYEELPSRQLKVKVTDRSIFKTTAADTILTHPTHIQAEIDKLVAQIPRGRAFVRPSGTEDIVRVYAEAETREQCDLLAENVSNLIK